MATKILIGFGLRAVREALGAALARQPGLEIVGQADDTASAFRLTRELRPDLLIVDDLLPDFSDIDLLKTVPVEQSRTRILLLVKDRAAARTVPAGAIAVAPKDAPLEDLLAAIAAAMAAKPPKPRRAQTGFLAAWPAFWAIPARRFAAGATLVAFVLMAIGWSVFLPQRPQASADRAGARRGRGGHHRNDR